VRRTLAILTTAAAVAATALAGTADAGTERAPSARAAGGTIVFADEVGIVAIRADGTHARRLTTGGGAPAWSPDGKRIAVGQQSLWITDENGSNSDVVGPEAGLCDTPSWEPSGKRIVCVGPTDDRQSLISDAYGIFIVAVGSGRERLVRGSVESFAAPDFSPDGKRIVFTDRKGILRVLDLGTRRSTALGPGLSPDWSPRGDLIAYSTATAIVVIRPDGSGRRTLVRSKGTVEHPAWSPDGSRVVYALFVGEGWSAPTSLGLRIVPAAGGKSTVLTRTGYQPDWRAG
jgi:Tol biopolymer transport system component